MKRLFTLISAIAVGIATMFASTLSDIKSEISKIKGTTVIDASQDIHVQEYSINNCEVIMLTPEIMDKVASLLSKIPEDLVFADVNDDEGTKVKVWADQEEGNSNGEMLFYVDSEGQLLVIYAQGDLKTMEAGVHFD